MLTLFSLSSGSGGNCLLIKSPTTSILVDLGISARRACSQLSDIGTNPKDIHAVVLTHSHIDHIKGVDTFCKKFSTQVFANRATAHMLDAEAIEICEQDFFVGDITIAPFRVSHDVPAFGYSFFCRGKKITIMTDLGVVARTNLHNASDSDLVFIEANHDVDMLRNNARYPQSLKRRILSSYGHLSNECCAEAALSLSDAGVKSFVLAHLSKQNNDADLARDTVLRSLESTGRRVGKDFSLEVAYENLTVGPFYTK